MKYFSHKVVKDGMTFDSTKEYNRYLELLWKAEKGMIRDLQRQVRFEILPALYEIIPVQLKTKVKYKSKCKAKAKHYTADFVYFDVADNVMVIEDVKSKVTAAIRDYPLRKHLILLKVDELNSSPEEYRWEFREIT